jgi:mannonate dehydratase
MRLCMMIPPQIDRRWALARQMGVNAAIAKLAPELTGRLPPYEFEALESEVARYRAAGFEIIGLEGDQFDMSRIKFGQSGRDEDIERYKRMLQNMGKLGIPLLCYNFMVGIGWFRTSTAIRIRGGARVSLFDAQEAEQQGMTEHGIISRDLVWENYEYFIRHVLPAAEDAGVVMGLHPDDPPVPNLRGIGRIFTSVDAMEKALTLVPSPSGCITFCQGSIKTMGENVEAAARRFADKIAFVHIRDVKGTADRFEETFPEDGETDMAAMFRLYRELGLTCPIRPDHAPAMEGDPTHEGEVAGINVGYEANGMIYTVGFMKGLMIANGWRC